MEDEQFLINYSAFEELPPGQRLLQFAALLLIIATTFWYGWYFREVCIDDAAISFQYARNLAEGFGLTYHREMLPVEGFSNPLWTLMLSLSHFMGEVDLVAVSKLFGGLFFLATGILFFLYGSPFAWRRFLFAILFMNPVNAYWAFSGMENGLFQFLLVALFLFHQKHFNRAYSICAAAMILTRPEGVLYALIAVVMARKRLDCLRWVIVPLLAYQAFRMLYFHDFLPNTFWAKRNWIHSADLQQNIAAGWKYFLYFFKQYFFWSWLGIVLLAYGLYRQQWMLLMILLGHLFFLCVVGGDWMRHYRFVMPVIPLYCFLLAELISDIVAWRIELFAITGVVLVNLIFVTANHWCNMAEYLAQPYLSVKQRIARGREFEKIGKKLGLTQVSLMDPEAGGTAWGTDLKIYDLVGLTNKEIGKSNKQLADFKSYLNKSKPDFIYCSGVWINKTGIWRLAEIYRDYLPLEGQIYFDPKTKIARLIRKDLMNKLLLQRYEGSRKTVDLK